MLNHTGAIKVYAIAGLLSGLAGVVLSARAITGQGSMGVSYELDAIAAVIIVDQYRQRRRKKV